MKQRYFLELAFDGTNYFGWQIQANQISVQEKVSDILSTLYNTEISIVGCGRTDSGVHAKQFFAHFDTAVIRTNLFERLRFMFPKDIELINVHKVASDNHARFDATQRSYTYNLHQRKNIFKRHYSLGVDLNKLNLEEINNACKVFLEQKDYSQLSKKRPGIDNYLSDVSHVEFILSKNKKTAVFKVSANRFLHNQIRRMLGVLLNIGLNKISVLDLKNAMTNNKPLHINDTVAPNGLFLHSIKYPFIND